MMKAVEQAVTKRRQTIAKLKAADVNQLQIEETKIDDRIATAQATLKSCDQLLRDQNPKELLHFHSKFADQHNIAGTIPHMKDYLFNKGSLSVGDLYEEFGKIEQQGLNEVFGELEQQQTNEVFEEVEQQQTNEGFGKIEQQQTS
jgi:hypothetical protein